MNFENFVIIIFVSVSFAINGKNNVCISKALYFSIARELLKYFKNLDTQKNSARTFFVSMKFVINDKNNLCIHQTRRKLNFIILHELLTYFNNSGIWNIVSEKFLFFP